MSSKEKKRQPGKKGNDLSEIKEIKMVMGMRQLKAGVFFVALCLGVAALAQAEDSLTPVATADALVAEKVVTESAQTDDAEDSQVTQSANNNYEKAMAAYNRGYNSRAMKLLTKAASQGLVEAQLKLGDIYFAGEVTIANPGESFNWYKKAADQGSALGEYKVGMMYLRGQGTKRDYDEAAKWLRKSADQGYARAQTNYGTLFLAGLGVDQDFMEAINWIRKAADQNYGDAQYLMGVAYEYGEGVAQDVNEAKAWYKKAVSNGNGNANGPLYRLEGYRR